MKHLLIALLIVSSAGVAMAYQPSFIFGHNFQTDGDTLALYIVPGHQFEVLLKWTTYSNYPHITATITIEVDGTVMDLEGWIAKRLPSYHVGNDFNYNNNDPTSRSCTIIPRITWPENMGEGLIKFKATFLIQSLMK